MKYTRIALLAISTAFVLSACKQDLDNDSDSLAAGGIEISSFEDLTVPDDFEYRTTSEIDVNIDIDYPDYPENTQYVVSVYKENPQTSSDALIVEGSLKKSTPFIVRTNVPTYLNSLWLKLEIAGLMPVYKEVELSGNLLDYTFDGTGKRSYKSGSRTIQVGPDCTSGCYQTISGTVSSVTIPAGQTICLTGTLTGGINWTATSGTLRVCGTVNAPNTYIGTWSGQHIEVASGGTFICKTLQMNSNCSFKVYDNTSVEIENLYINNNTTEFLNYSNDFNVDNNFTCNGPSINNGTIYFEGNYKANQGTNVTHVNNGDIYVQGKFDVNGHFTNNGMVSVEGEINNNSNAYLVNNCKLLTEDDFNNSSTFICNNGYVSVNGTFEQNVNWLNVTLNSQSMISTDNLLVNGPIVGAGTGTSSLKGSDNTTINSNGSISGTVDVCDQDGIETNWGSISGGATAACNNYIPTSGCNPEGIGTVSNPDSDGDGVADVTDEYPNDPSRAFNSYYPNSSEYATTAFEDLWPSTGDYDFNDLVMAYQYQTVTNANNEVVDLIGRYHIEAVGAGYQNGFGVSLPVASSTIASVTGTHLITGNINLNANGTEAGHTGEAVVMIYDNINNYLGGSMINVTPITGTTMNIDTTVVTINFATPQSSIGAAPFNPFVFVDQTRGREVHLTNYEPTDLVDPSYFGTSYDNSNVSSGIYYTTAGQLPWAIDIPASFDYMIEKQDILGGYTKFDDWAVSGGAQYQDWYLNLSGYREISVLY